jgi:hypothetical protein
MSAGQPPFWRSDSLLSYRVAVEPRPWTYSGFELRGPDPPANADAGHRRRQPSGATDWVRRPYFAVVQYAHVALDAVVRRRRHAAFTVTV